MAGRKRKAVAVSNSTTQKGVSGAPKIATRATKHAPVNTTQQNNNEALKRDSKNKTPNTKSENVHQAKRQKTSHPEETLKPTRTSARLRARAQTPAPDVPPQLSPKSLDESAEAVLDPVANEAVDDTKADGASELTSSFTEDVGSRLTPKSNDVMCAAETNEPVHQIGNRRKRKLGSESNSMEDSTSAVKKPKIVGENVPEASAVQVDSAPVPEDDQHNQHPEDDGTVPEPGETDISVDHDHDMSDHQKSGTTMTRGRGRGGRGRGRGRGKGPINNLIKAGYPMSGRGRGRGAGRGGGRGRGRGGGGGGGGRGGGQGGRQNNGDSDVEDAPERPLLLNPYTQKLSDRQRELKQNFKRLAAAQKLLLAELARRTQQTLARDKNAHREPPEFEEVEAQLSQHLLRRLEILEHEHHLRVQQAEILLEAETRAINDRFEAHASNIQDEYFYATRGNYMSLIEKEQRGDDDEHTEPDLDDPTADQSKSMTTEQQPATSVYEHEPYYLHEPKITRGYSSRMARERGGADAYERGKHGWDDFLQRAKLRELSQEDSAANAMHLLLAASREALVDEAGPPPLSSVDTLPPAAALFALADAASTASRAHVAPPVQTSAVLQLVQAVPQQQLPSLMLQQAPPTRPTLPAANGYPEVYTINGPTLPPRLPPLPEALSSFPSSRHGHGGDSSLQYHQVLPTPASAVRIPAAQALPPFIYPDHSYPPPQAHSAGGRAPPPPPPPPPSHLGSAIDNYQSRPAHSH